MSDGARFGNLAANARDLVARRFALTVRRLHLTGGGDEGECAALMACAGRCWSSAQDNGDSCIALDADAAALVAASPAVAVLAAGGDLSRAAPLVLDRGHLFLERLWRAEWQLATHLLALAEPAPLADDDRLVAGLHAVLGEAEIDAAQQRAVMATLTRRLAVISGGPGTGKTTTLARLIAVCSRLAPLARVAVAAPTGKAAARVGEALQAQLAGRLAPGEATLPSATTLHRLLGIRGPGSRSAFGPERPLPYDLVVVDEASMIDLEMASALAAAIGPRARLVLCGDRDQLASVEAGAVFAALCAASDERLSAGVVTLERNYRQRETPEIVAWAHDARAGSLADERAAGSGPVFLRQLSGDHRADQAALVRSALAGYEPAFDLLRGEGGGPAIADELLALLARYRVLCALRRGPLGVDAVNRVLAAAVRAIVAADPESSWYPGRFVIVGRNTPELGLFNGDTGVCLRRDGALMIAFPGGDRLHWVAAAQMPSCAEAFALSVHQSQGSEFERVALVAAPLGHRLARRELIYTGITRARREIEIFAAPGALADASGRATERAGLLAERLSGAND